MKKIIISLLAIFAIVSIYSCAYDEEGGTEGCYVEDVIIQGANVKMELWEFEEGRTFSVTVDEQDIYHIDINGEEVLVEIEEEQIVENTKTNIAECDSKVSNVVKTLKEKVINYINESYVLRDKEELISYINNIPVQMADFSIDAEAEYDVKTDSIYINNKYQYKICEWGITHELVQALSQKTNGGVENQRYHDELFYEVLTHVIISEMMLESDDGCVSNYYEQYGHVYCYIGCVGIKGIEAYFYGYDEILEIIPEAELDVFVEELKYVGYNMDAIWIVSNCINDWGLELYLN